MPIKENHQNAQAPVLLNSFQHLQNAQKIPNQVRDDAPSIIHPKEFGGVDGPEPTRYGDWTIRGRCSDF